MWSSFRALRSYCSWALSSRIHARISFYNFNFKVNWRFCAIASAGGFSTMVDHVHPVVGVWLDDSQLDFVNYYPRLLELILQHLRAFHPILQWKCSTLTNVGGQHVCVAECRWHHSHPFSRRYLTTSLSHKWEFGFNDQRTSPIRNDMA